MTTRMRIFLTGGTGYVGGAIAEALRERGHDVAALARPEADTARLREIGAVIVAGDIDSLPSLTESLAEYETIVHTAQSGTRTAELANKALDVFTTVGANLIATSGVWVLGNTQSTTEHSTVNPLEIVSWRAETEQRVLDAGGCVIRPGCVYGGKQSLLKDWFAAVEQHRPIQIVGDGRNRWAMVDLHELAKLYVRAVERRAAGILHGVDDTRAPLEQCARAVGPSSRLEFLPADAMRAKLGAFVQALVVDQVIDSSETRQRMGWHPRRTFTSSVPEQWDEWRQQNA
jgi:nucleoside-diphosphate-sugar epimerase